MTLNAFDFVDSSPQSIHFNFESRMLAYASCSLLFVLTYDVHTVPGWDIRHTAWPVVAPSSSIITSSLIHSFITRRSSQHHLQPQDYHSISFFFLHKQITLFANVPKNNVGCCCPLFPAGYWRPRICCQKEGQTKVVFVQHQQRIWCPSSYSGRCSRQISNTTSRQSRYCAMPLWDRQNLRRVLWSTPSWPGVLHNHDGRAPIQILRVFLSQHQVRNGYHTQNLSRLS